MAREQTSVGLTPEVRCQGGPSGAWGDTLVAGPHENTNGLIRRYLKKRASMEHLTQQDCQRIADRLNRRPRKRLAYRTPAEVYVP